MSRTVRIIVILAVLALLAGGAAFAYIYFSGGSGDPSRAASATLEPEVVDTSEGVLFEIVPEESEVRFIIDELLRGQPNRVVGRTNQVAGQIFVNFENPSESRVSTIEVNVFNLVTDQEMRNRAIRTAILQSNQEQFEFARFTPTSIEGLPDTIRFGEPIEFTIVGDLTVRHITNPVTFQATVTPVSETMLSGLATATVTREAYELQIPSAPGVADVSNDVGLEIEFVARAVDAAAEAAGNE